MKDVRNYLLEHLPQNLKEAKDEAVNEIDNEDGLEIENIENAAIEAAISEFESIPETEEKF